MLGNRAVDHFAAMGLKRAERAHFVCAHQTAISDYVGSKDGGETAFQI